MVEMTEIGPAAAFERPLDLPPRKVRDNFDPLSRFMFHV